VEVKPILLDTNAYSALKKGNSDAVAIVNDAESVAISVVVLGELLAGFRVGSRQKSNSQELQELLALPGVFVLPIESTTADHYASIYEELRRAGRPILTNDLWIAATAIQHGLTLFTYDDHFSDVPQFQLGRIPSDFQ
jgi:predicted nucleic acid-binding protein